MGAYSSREEKKLNERRRGECSGISFESSLPRQAKRYHLQGLCRLSLYFAEHLRRRAPCWQTLSANTHIITAGTCYQSRGRSRGRPSREVFGGLACCGAGGKGAEASRTCRCPLARCHAPTQRRHSTAYRRTPSARCTHARRCRRRGMITIPRRIT